MNERFSWTITANEKRKQIRVFIARTWFLFCVAAITAPFFFTNTYVGMAFWGTGQLRDRILLSVAGVIASIGLFFVVNKFFPYQDRTYVFDENGLECSVGSRMRRYRWGDFSHFYQYSRRNDSAMGRPLRIPLPEEKKRMQDVEKETEGEIFYIQKKKAFLGIGKVFVVVRSEPENTDIVEQILRQKLPEQQMTSTADLGLVLYE